MKPQTFASYRDLIDRYMNPRFGSVRLQAVQPAMLNPFVRRPPQSRRFERSAIGADHHRQGARHPAQGVPRRGDHRPAAHLQPGRPRQAAPQAGRSNEGIWTPADLRAFLDTARSHRLFPFFHVAAYTGTRRGELLNLRWLDIDLDNACLEICGTVAVINGQRVEGPTKGGHTRTISLDDATVAVLRAHQSEQRRERFVAGPDWGVGDYVFTRGVWGSRSTPTRHRNCFRS